MFENALWDLIFEGLEAEQRQIDRAWIWMRQTYEGSAELHTATMLHNIPIVTMAPTERGHVSHWENSSRNDWNPKIRSKSKAVSVSVDKAWRATFDLVQSGDYTLPWITTTLWQRPNKKAVAWMLGLKNVIIIRKPARDREVYFYQLFCEELTEMVPRNLVPVPDHLQF